MFWLFAALAIGGALMCITRRSPVASALWLVQTLFSLAAIFVLLDAQFIAALQVMVYAGAIMVLFLFVVMLLNVPREDAAEWDRSHPLYRPGAVRAGAVLAILMALQLGWALSRTPGMSTGVAEDRAAASSVADLGVKLFSGAGANGPGYMFAFEVTSILIIIAMVGAVVIARKRED